MKVLIATGLYPPQIGGPATHAVAMEQGLPGKGVRVTTVPFEPVLRLPPFFRHIVYFFKLLARSRGVSVIYALDPVSVGVPAFFAAKLLRKKFLLRVAGDYAWEQAVQRRGETMTLDRFVVARGRKPLLVRILAAVQYFVAYYADRVIVPSEYLKRIVVAWGVRARSISVVYNAFTPVVAEGSMEETKRALGYSGIVIASAGRLVPWKGFRVLIDAVADMHETHPTLMCVIMGDGPEREALEKHAAERSISAHIRFLGKLEPTELARAIAAADLFVLNTGYEGFSHQLLEVMALGVPIVTTPVGGNPELLINEKEGLLVPHDDIGALKEAIGRLIKDPILRQVMRDAARERSASFTAERMIEGVITTLRAL